MKRKARCANQGLCPVRSTSRKKLSTPPTHAWPLFILTLIFAMILSAGASGFTLANVDVTPNSPTTTDDLVCRWNVTGADGDSITTNVTWFKNTVMQFSRTASGSNDVLDSTYTSRGELWNCTVRVSNSSIVSILSDNVTIANSLPIPVSIQNQTVYEDQLWTTTLSSSDADGDSLTFSCDPTDILDSCTSAGVLTWTPVLADVGLYNLTFLVTDKYPPAQPTYVGKTIRFNVTAVNDRPVFSFPSPKNASISEGQKLYYSITINDEENNTGPFSFSMNSSFIPFYGTDHLDFNTSNSKTFNIIIKTGRASDFTEVGNWTVWVSACDPANASLCINDSFRLEVKSINHNPNVTFVENKSALQGQEYNISVNAADFDETDILNFSISSSCSLPNPWRINTTNTSQNASAFIYVAVLNNTHIACKNITVTIKDNRNGQGTRNLILPINNTNDAPVIHETSNYSSNSHSNKNISDLYAYSSVGFNYKINASDIDIDLAVDTSDFLNYSDNSSTCVTCPRLTTNSSSGVITFLPNSSYTGTFSYMVNAVDKYGASASRKMVITVIGNQLPYFNQTPQNQTLFEDTNFIYKLNATDPEGFFDSFSDNTGLFNISQAGLINVTPVCTDVGNYTVAIKINDTVGAENITLVGFEVRMSPDAPVLDRMAESHFIEGFPYLIDINTTTTDQDLTCGQQDSIDYTSTFVQGSSLFNITSSGLISFTPNITSDGSYRVNLTAVDSYGRKDSYIWNFTVINASQPPVINNVTPYGTPIIYGWATPANLGANYTLVTIYENTTLVYDHNSTDPDSSDVTYTWIIDGETSGSGKNISKYYDFSSSGYHNVTLIVSDYMDGEPVHWIRFTWNTSVLNKNRPPQLNSSLTNESINGTRTITDYLTKGNDNSVRFYDPDGDTLAYNYSATHLYTISLSGGSVTFKGVTVGSEDVIFTARDAEYSVQANNVTITVVEVPQDVTPEPSSSGSRSSSSTQEVLIPYTVLQEVEKEKDIYLDLIVPEPITLYKNDTIREVISLVNNGNQTLKGIVMSATTNATEAKIDFSKPYFSELRPGETVKTELILTAYRLLNHYEIIIWANVTDPAYKDKAIIYMNSIEKSKGNQSVTATKITFAEDLLASNPECIELNEFLRKADDYVKQQDYEAASNVLDSVIQGCKYLVSQSKLRDEKPTGFLVKLGLDRVPYLKPILVILGLVVVALVYTTFKMRKSNDSQEGGG